MKGTKGTGESSEKQESQDSDRHVIEIAGGDMSEMTGRIHDTKDLAPHLDKRKLEAKDDDDPVHLRPLCDLVDYTPAVLLAGESTRL